MTDSYILMILPIDNLKSSSLQHCLLLLVLALPICHLDQLINVVRTKFHLVYLPVKHQSLIQQLEPLCLQLGIAELGNQIEDL